MRNILFIWWLEFLFEKVLF